MKATLKNILYTFSVTAGLGCTAAFAQTAPKKQAEKDFVGSPGTELEFAL